MKLMILMVKNSPNQQIMMLFSVNGVIRELTSPRVVYSPRLI